MLQGKISDISKGHKEIIQLTQGKRRRQLYICSAAETGDSRKVRVTLLSSSVLLLTDRGTRVCARCITEMKTLIKLLIFLVMPVTDDV